MENHGTGHCIELNNGVLHSWNDCQKNGCDAEVCVIPGNTDLELISQIICGRVGHYEPKKRATDAARL
jgi:hypothetical protein